MSDLDDLAEMVDVPPREGGRPRRVKPGTLAAIGNVLARGRAAAHEAARRKPVITLATVNLPPVE